MSYVMCHVSRVTCHVSHVTCHMSHFLSFFLFFRTKWWSLSLEGLLSTGPTPSSFSRDMEVRREEDGQSTCPGVGLSPCNCPMAGSPTFRHRTFWHQDTLTPPFLTPRHYDYKIFWHRDILTPRHFATQTLCHPDIVPLHTNQDILTPRHFAPKTFCHSSHLDTKTFWQFPAISY